MMWSLSPRLTTLHVPQSVRALRRAATSSAKAHAAHRGGLQEDQVDAAKKYKRWFMTGQVGRYTPGFRAAKQLISDGVIGELVFIESEYYHNYAHVEGVGKWRSDLKIRREGFIWRRLPCFDGAALAGRQSPGSAMLHESQVFADMAGQ